MNLQSRLGETGYKRYEPSAEIAEDWCCVRARGSVVVRVAATSRCLSIKTSAQCALCILMRVDDGGDGRNYHFAWEKRQ